MKKININKQSMKKIITLSLVIIFASLILAFTFESGKGNNNNYFEKFWLNSVGRTEGLNPYSPMATTLISPTGDGGFETGTTFVANNWTAVNGSYNNFYVGTAPTVYAGSRCAFTGTSGSNWTGTGNASVNHIYRNITFPSGETNITLSFYYKLKINESLTGYDYFKVFLVPTTTTPVAGTELSSGQIGSTIDANTGSLSWTQVTITIPSSAANTTQRLVLSWRNDGSSPYSSIALDNISLTSTVPPAPMSGIYTINNSLGTSGTNFASFTDAINAINFNGISSSVTFNVSSGQTFTEDPPALTATGTGTGGTPTNSITFQKSGVLANPIIKPTGTVGASDAGIKIAGGDYITFDGIDIAIASGSAVEYGYYLYGASATNGAQYNTIKNSNITLNRANTGSVGILTYANLYTVSNATGTNSYNKFYNINISNVYNGINFIGNSTTYSDVGNEIGTTGGGNTIIGGTTADDIGNSSVNAFGIWTSYQNNISISNSLVRNVTSASAVYAGGIYLSYSSGNSNIYNCTINNISNNYTTGNSYNFGIENDNSSGTVNIYNNKVYTLKSTYIGTSYTPIMYGIYSNLAGGTSNIYNNALSDFQHGRTTANATPVIFGIYTIGSYNFNIYFNSVSIASSAYPSSSCLYVSAGTLNVKNNIFSNTSTYDATSTSKRYCFYNYGGTISSSSNNLLYINTSAGANNLVGYGSSADQASLQKFAASISGTAPVDGMEGGSANANPNFAGTTDLTLSGSSPARNSGTPISSPSITTDITGTARDGSRPNIGAYESAVTQADNSAPVLSNVTITGSGTTTPSISVALTDNSNSASNATVTLWYRLSTSSGVYSSIAADGLPSGTINGTYSWSSSALSSLGTGTYNFYITARDGQGAGSGIWVNPMWTTGFAGFSTSDPPNFTGNPDGSANVRSFQKIGNLAGGTYDVGNAQPVLKKLSDVANQLNSSTLTGDVVYELNSDYIGTTGETYPITFNQYNTSGGNWTVTIRVKSLAGARTTSGNYAGNLINLNGADRITFEGREGGSGSTKAWTITNSNNSGAVFNFDNDATSNSIKYCTISGTTHSITSGIIKFGSTAPALGNSGNTIDNCSIDGGAGSTTSPTAVAYYGIYSSGNSTYLNSGNTISNCNIFNFFDAATSNSAIYLPSNNTDWVISNNRIYQTATRTFTSTQLTYYGINIASGNNYSISGNIFGFGASDGTGLTTITGSSNIIRPIYLTVGINTVTSVMGNTIAGINQNTSRASTLTNGGAFVGIYYTGLVNVGSLGNGNTIGSLSGTGSITIGATSTTASTAPSMGILNFGSNNTNISYNNIGSISVTTGGGGGSYVGFHAIRITSSSGTTNTISNNIIGGTTANSISSAPTNGQIAGIYTTVGANTISGNTISNLTNSGGNTGTTSSASVIGIYQGSTDAGQVLTQNTIYALSNSHATAAVCVTGIHYAGPTTGTNLVARNLVHSLSIVSTSASSDLRGINYASGLANVQNNMIRLGIDASGNSLTTGIQITGLYDAVSSTNTGMYFNSIFIGGTGVGTQTGNTYAFRSDQTTNVRTYQDNIFYNARSNSSGTGGKHYAVRVSGTGTNPTGLVLSYNDYFANGANGSVFGYYNGDVTSFINWKSTLGLDAGSINGDPQFIAPTGTSSTVDLHISPSPTPTPIEAAGLAIGTVTDDFDGQTRSTLTPTDIGADAGNFTPSDISPPIISYTALGNTTSTSTVSFSNVIITDASGVNIAAGTRPRVYYQKSGQGNVINDNTNATDGWKWVEANGTNNTPFDFTIDLSKVYGGVASGNTIKYFVVAQDLAATPNVGINAGTFAVTPSSVVLTTAAGIGGTQNTFTIVGSISGTKNIPGDYPTLTGATGLFNAINTSVVTGNITAVIKGDITEPGTVALNQWTEDVVGANYTLAIQPDGTTTRTLSGSYAGGLIRLNGADRVTFDGRYSGSGNYLTITNTASTGTVAAIQLISLGSNAGATYNTIRNCNISTGFNTSASYGIAIGGATIANTGADNDNNSIIANNISKAYTGIWAEGNATTNPGLMDNLTVTNNIIGSGTATSYIGFNGIVLAYATGANVSNNTIYNIIIGSSTPVGLTLSTGVVSSTINANNINNITATGSGGYGGRGIYAATGNSSSNLTISNNMIYQIGGDGYSSYSGSSPVGMYFDGATGGLNIYYNSVYMSGTLTRNTSTLTAAILFYSNTITSVDLRDNIFQNSMNNSANTTAKNYAIYSSSTSSAFTNINYNDYYVSGTQGVLGSMMVSSTQTDETGLVEWRGGTGKDANSVSGDPKFISTSNLHIDPNAVIPPPISNAGTPISGVTTDFDGDTRSGTTPDIGADEYTGILPAAFNLLTPANSSTSTKSGSLTWESSTYATGYDVYVQVSGSADNIVSSNQTGTTYAYSLSANTTYTWKVVAKNGNGQTPAPSSGYWSFTTSNDPPTAPSGLGATNVTDQSIDLNWTNTAGMDANYNRVYQTTTSGSNWVQIGGDLDPTSTFYQAVSLIPNTRYYYKVVAYNTSTGESTPPATVDALTLAKIPGAPALSNPTLVTMKATIAPLTNPAATQFVIRVNSSQYVKTDGTLSGSPVWGTYAQFGGASGITVTGLSSLTSYTFDVMARNSDLTETVYGTSATLSTLGALAGDYSIGAKEFNRVSGRNISYETRKVKEIIDVPVYADKKNDKNTTSKVNNDIIRYEKKEVEKEIFVPMENGKEVKEPLCYYYPKNGKDKSPLSGAYPTITAAIADLATRGVSASVRFLLLDATYSSETLPITVNTFAGASATNTVTILPQQGGVINSVISGSSTTSVFLINSADYFIIDGSNNGTSSQNLTIINTNTATATNAINITGTSGDNAVGNVIKNCKIQSFYQDIYTIYANGTIILNNDIYGNLTSGANTNYYQSGIYLSTGSINTKVQKNKIHDFYYTSSSGYSTFGIYYSSDANTVTEISNNAIYNISGDGEESATYPEYAAAGIFIYSGGNIQLYYNSIYMTGSVLGKGYISCSSALQIGSSITLLDVRNNSFRNSMQNFSSTYTANIYSVRSYSAASAFTSLDNNDHYVVTAGTYTTPYIGYISTTSPYYYSTLNAWKSVTGKEANSKSADPLYTSTTNLRPSLGSPLLAGGTVISGITTDMLGITRGTPPSIGAYEQGVDAAGPAITYTTLGNTSSTSNRTLGSVTITDYTGVDWTIAPRIYYKKSTDANTFGGNTSTDNGWKWTAANVGTSPTNFTIDYSIINGGSVTTNDVIQYFVVAQDLVSTPNVSASPSTGFAGTSVSVISTAPTSPNSYTILGSISGTIHVGTAQSAPYNKLTTAIGDYNNKVQTGPVTFILDDATYSTGETYPITINANSGADASNTLTIKPNTISTISGSNSSSLIKLNGAKYVTIDGSNNGSTDKSLTFSNTYTTGSNAVIWVASLGTAQGATYNTIKNCNIANGISTTSNYGIYVGGALGSSGDDNDYLTIQNNKITKAYNGIYCYASTSGLLDGLNINSNIIGGDAAADYVAFKGIYLSGATAPTITGNTIYNTISTISGNTAGIEFNSNVANGYISKNIIHDIQNNNTLGYGAFGINFESNGNSGTQIDNNVIYKINTINYSASSLTYNPFGIRISQGSGFKLYYNSINLSGTQYAYGSTGTLSAALLLSSTSGVTGLDIRNNIFANGIVGSSGSSSYGIYAGSSTTYTLINYNDYYGYGTYGKLGYSGTDKTTLLLWQGATNQDANSNAANPLFVSATNLTINLGSPVLATGTPISGISTDILGVSRSGSTPSMGAYENGVDLSGPVISYTALTNQANTSNVTLTPVNITDASGVDWTNAPRIYYKKSTDASTFGGNTSTDNGWKWTVANVGTSPTNFTIDYSKIYTGTVANGDFIQYFVVAQDIVGTPNVSANPSTGFTGSGVANILTAPTTPNQYKIIGAPLSGVYDISGLALFNKITGKNLTAKVFTRKVLKEVAIDDKSTSKVSENANENNDAGDEKLNNSINGNTTVKTQKMEVDEEYTVIYEGEKEYDGSLFISANELLKSGKATDGYVMSPNAAGTYASITAAVAALNESGVGGAVTFNLVSTTYSTGTGGETFPIVINSVNGMNSSNTLTIKPATGKTPTISGLVDNSALIKVFNSNYVTIDGSNGASGGTSRDLTITNTSVTTGYGLWIASSGTTPITNFTLKNSNVNTGTQGASAIYFSDGTTLGNQGYFNTINIQNNNIQKAWCGIFVYAGTTQNGYNLNITNNIMNASGSSSLCNGISIFGVSGATIGGNTIGNITYANNTSIGGIFINTGTINATVEKNQIYNISNTFSNGYGAYGIAVVSGATNAAITIRNNTIYNITSNGRSTVSRNPFGIYFSAATTGVSIYYNSIYLYGSTLNQTSATSYGIYLISGSSADIRNNIIVNNLGLSGSTGTGAVGIYAATNNAQFTSIDNNDYYVNPTNGTKVIGQIAGNTYTTFSGWKGVSGGDANSFSSDPSFTSNTDLHIINSLNEYTAYPAPSCAGVTISGITTDIEGTVRRADYPDIGAYEFVVNRAITTSGTFPTGTNGNTHQATDYGTITISGSAITALLSENIEVKTSTTLSSTGNLNFGTYSVSGAGSFTTGSGTGLLIGSTTGLNGNLTSSGTIALDAGTNYTYNGALGQVTGTLLPTAVNNLTISNANGVSLSGSTAVNGILNLSSGTFSIGGNTLTMNSTLSGTGPFTGSTSSNLTVNGSGALGTSLNFTSGYRTLNNFTYNRAALVDKVEGNNNNNTDIKKTDDNKNIKDVKGKNDIKNSKDTKNTKDNTTTKTSKTETQTTDNPNVGTLSLGTDLAVNILTLSAGTITTTDVNLLTIAGTDAATSLVYTGGNISGPLARTLPTGLTAGTDYLYPISKTATTGFDLIDATTSGGSVVIKAEVFDASCGGSPDLGSMTSLNSNRYWSTTIISGTANLTNAKVKLTDAGIGSANAIAISTTKTGNYAKASTSDPVGSYIISDALTASSFNFFVLGVKGGLPLAGILHVGTTKDFTTVTEAMNALSARGVSAGVTFILDDATYPSETFPININSFTGGGSSNPVLIKPLTTATITGASSTGLFVINGADYITIDGLSGTDRGLTFENTSASAGAYVLGVLNSGGNLATNNIIENCKIKGSGTASASGLNAAGTTSLSILNNEIFTTTSGEGSNPQYGIKLGTGSTGTIIRKNVIHDISNAIGSFGIYFNSDATTVTEITNNLIYKVTSSGSSTLGSTAAGMYIASGGNIQMYYNSIYMSGSSSTGFTTGIGVELGATLLDIRNNIFQNSITGGTSTYGIYSSALNSGYAEIDYNDYYAAGAGANVGYMGGDKATISAWAAASRQDLHSYNGDPGFTSTTNLLPDNTLKTSWNVFSKGIQLSSVSTDINGTSRSTSTTTGPTCLGAYEFTVNSTSNAPPSLSGASVISGTTSLQQGGRSVLDVTWGSTATKVNNGTKGDVTTKPVKNSDTKTKTDSKVKSKTDAPKNSTVSKTDTKVKSKTEYPIPQKYSPNGLPANVTVQYFSNATATASALDTAGVVSVDHILEVPYMPLAKTGYGYWFVTTDGNDPNTPVSFTIHYGLQEIGNTTAESDLILAMYDQNNRVWVPFAQGASGDGVSILNTTNKTITVNGIPRVDKVIFMLTDKNFPLKRLGLDLTVLIQGLYNDYAGPGLMIQDTVTAVIVSEVTTPWSVMNSIKVPLSDVGHGFSYSGYWLPTDLSPNTNTNYWIKITHRNAVETWCNLGDKQFSAVTGVLAFDFTSALSQAYTDGWGIDPLILMNEKYCVYNGDINKDTWVDGSDMNIIEIDAGNFAYGWIPSDLTGDMWVDGSDMNVVEINSANFVHAQIPSGAMSPLQVKKNNEMKLIIEQAKKDKIEQKSKKDINLNKNIKK